MNMALSPPGPEPTPKPKAKEATAKSGVGLDLLYYKGILTAYNGNTVP
jgi:hypothetical protein